MAHAARVAAAATVIIMAVYVCVCVGFDIVDRHRLVAQVNTQLEQRLDEMTRNPSAAGALASYETPMTRTTLRCSRGASAARDPPGSSRPGHPGSQRLPGRPGTSPRQPVSAVATSSWRHGAWAGPGSWPAEAWPRQITPRPTWSPWS